MDENVQIFVTEAQELLIEMEDALLELENRMDDEILNLIFRAAHTIKGSAGLFGFEHIIQFSHVVENILDDMRNCLIPITSELITVLMRSKDHIGDLINALPDENQYDSEEENTILQLLNAFKTVDTASDNDSGSTIQAEPVPTKPSQQPNESHDGQHYHISIRLGLDTFRQGFDPAALFKQMEELGRIKQAVLIEQAIPWLTDMDSESCYMGWEIALQSQASKETISEIFEFLDDVIYTILPPKSQIGDYRHLIQQLPEEDELALGQILIQTGTLTEEELQLILQQQSQQQRCEPSNIPPPLTGDLLVENKIVQPEVVEEALQKQKNVQAKKQQAMSFVKVDSAKLDKLVNLVGELVINGAKMSQLSAQFDDDDLNETMEDMMVSLEEMRASALGLRMIPVGTTFNRFHRVVRDTSNDLGKEIRLEITGAETELDKTVIEKIADPLMHLVRNSLDHGIEMPDDRVRVGKPREGLIKLNAHHEAGMIVIEIKDDGKGLDADQLLEKAIEKGLVKESQSLSRDEIYNLIFEAGFSMAKEISNISGRGVGMDVVRRNIEALRGTIQIASKKGEGTTISIQLPLTLAIIDGFHVNVNQEDFIIPLDMIQECITLNARQKEEVNTHNYITLREEVLPLIPLNQYFNLNNNSPDNSKTSTVEHENVVVAQFGKNKVGLSVDDLLGETQAVIKPLGRVFRGLNGFAGFTILGSGHVALVIDVPGLVKEAVSHESQYFSDLDKNQVGLNQYYH